MTKKKTLQTRAGAQGMSKKPRPRNKKMSGTPQSPSQTSQPYERDVKHRIGQYSGVGEPPLMKK